MNIWISSDYHFNHDKEFIWKARGFESVEEMNETIVKKNNECVAPEDTLIICGDLMLGGADKLEEGLALLNRMNGLKLVVGGNHDTPNRREAYLRTGIPVFDAYAFTYRKYHFYASHYPTLTGNLEKESLKQVTCNLFGHTHQTSNFYNEIPFMYHVGVDSHECYPVLLDDVIKEMNEKVEECKAQLQIAVAEAENAKASNDARVKAEEEIAKRNNSLAIQKAQLKQEADTKQAQANAAMEIESENQRKLRDVAAADADIARQEKEIDLKEREVAIKERALEAEVKKTAEAKKYAAQQEADAKLYATQKQSEADLYERQKTAEAERFEAEQRAEAQRATAEAVRVQGEAEAAATKARGEAEAAAIQAKAEAEAEGLMKKAEAMKQYGEAAKMDMQMEALKLYFQQLPAIAQATGQAYTNVDKIVMFGDDTSKLSGNIIKNVAQVSEGLSESLGIDVKTLLTGFLGGKLADSSNKE